SPLRSAFARFMRFGALSPCLASPLVMTCVNGELPADRRVSLLLAACLLPPGSACLALPAASLLAAAAPAARASRCSPQSPTESLPPRGAPYEARLCCLLCVTLGLPPLVMLRSCADRACRRRC